MFRKIRRTKQAVSPDDCLRILKEENRAALSVIGDAGYPYTIPVDFYYDEKDNRIYIHSAKCGHKIDAIKNNDKVCFTAWNQGYKIADHWEWNTISVVIFGRARLLDDISFWEDKLKKLTIKYYPTLEEAEAEMKSPAVNDVQMIAIDIEHMSGKLVNEK